ncbi:MAG: DnaJ domain-containing protein [Chloroflexota bacterium]
MAIDPDPYRTLGLARGASIDEIKRAYRRLAKIHHPDAAGEKNVPRFLAIQAAYEQLAGGVDDRSSSRPGGAPRKAWEADPDRSNATRRAYGGRGRWSTPGAAGGASAEGPTGGPAGAAGRSDGGSGTSGTDPRSRTGPGPRPGPSRSGRRGTGGSGTGAGSSTRPGAGAGGATAGSGTDAGASGTPPRGPRERKRNKATLGSTSYDGADGPFEPDWRGASWYGTTSGTYWTLNPKEYADPRKHGPEYQARARRATRPAAGDAPPADEAPTGFDPAAPPPDSSAPPHADARPAEGPTHTTSSWWESTAGAAGPEPATAGADPRATASERSGGAAGLAAPPPPDVGRALSDIGRAITDPTFGGGPGRLGRAFLGWLPIAFGASWLVGEITGCGRFAATCTGLADPLVLALQVGALLVLLALPVVGSIAAMGAMTLLGVAVGAAFALSATGEAADSESRRVALGAVLLVSWVAGIALAVARRARSRASTTRPVS